MTDQQAQEQERDFHRAECELENILTKVETGMAGKPDAQEIREIFNKMRKDHG